MRPLPVPNSLGRRPSLGYLTGMMKLGSRIEEAGLLLLEGETYFLRRDLGGRFRLDLRRVTALTSEQRVQITGVLVGAGFVDVSAIIPKPH
jgi:hypothetical protein